MKNKEENIDPQEEMETKIETYDEEGPTNDDEQAQDSEPEQVHPSLKEVIKENAREDEQPYSC